MASGVTTAPAPTAARVDRALDALWRRVLAEGWESWDPYDVWGRPSAVRVRRLYFRNRKLGAVPAVGVLALALPGMPGRVGLRRRRAPVALALYASASMARHRRTGDPAALDRAVELLDWIGAHATPSPSGPAWGHHFDWMTDVFLPAGTPTITVTPHVVDAAWEAWDLTGEERFRDMAVGGTRFVHHDLAQWRLDADRAMTAYTPLGIDGVVNATSYRALVLHEAIARGLADPGAQEEAGRNLAAVLAAQRPDGSWPYRITDRRNFTDTFHTCFVIEHLARIAALRGDSGARAAAVSGARYLIDRLLAGPLPPRYVGGRSTGVIAADAYDCAESIACLVAVADVVPDALPRAERLEAEVIRTMQRPDGAFWYRRYRVGPPGRLLSHRWAQAPMAYALESLRTKLGDPGSHS